MSNLREHDAEQTAITKAEGNRDIVKQYEKLHDGLSDMIEGGRLTEADIPDDYQWLVETLVACNYRQPATRDPFKAKGDPLTANQPEEPDELECEYCGQVCDEQCDEAQAGGFGAW